MSLTLRNKLLVASIAAAASYLWWPGEAQVPTTPRAHASSPTLSALTHPLDVIDPPLPTPALRPPTSGPVDPTPGHVPSGPTRPDPFAYPIPITNEPVAASPSAYSPIAALKLQAISISNGKGLAVINRRVVAVGDSINGWRIETIESGRVNLRGTTTAEAAVLEFDRRSHPAR